MKDLEKIVVPIDLDALEGQMAVLPYLLQEVLHLIHTIGELMALVRI